MRQGVLPEAVNTAYTAYYDRVPKTHKLLFQMLVHRSSIVPSNYICAPTSVGL